MINFEELKAKIAEIATTDPESPVEATDVVIGFTKRAYEITFDTEVDLNKKQIADIVTALGEAVVKTIAFVSCAKDSIIVIFDMNYMD